jgi:anti-sigma factor RsiW
MTACDSMRENLTAWIDGELPLAEERQVTAHIDACETCAAEAAALRRAITWQEHAMPQALLEAPVDVGALRLGMRRRLAAVRAREESAPQWSWTWLVRPFALATAAAAVVLLAVVWQVGEPEPLLVSLGVEQPPAEVVNNPEMFRYFDVIRNLEAFEHFEAVEAVSLEEDRARADSVQNG